MKIATVIGLMLGLALTALLVAWQGVEPIARSLAAVGWGILLLPLVYLPHLGVSAASWRMLFPPGGRPSLRVCFNALWMGRSLNTLLPAAGLGEDVVKVRLASRNGISGADSTASAVVDKTVDTVSLLLWAAIGVLLLVWLEADGAIVGAALGGIALLAAGVAVFVVLQRAGMFGFVVRALGRVTGRGARFVDGAAGVDAGIRALYGRPGPMALALVVRVLARVLMTAEVWLAAALMGTSMTVWDAMMIRSLTAALRGAAFFIPNGLGVQEGLYVLLGGLVGMAPDVMVAISLATRGRELIISIPGVLAWQHMEGRWLWRRASGEETPRAG